MGTVKVLPTIKVTDDNGHNSSVSGLTIEEYEAQFGPLPADPEFERQQAAAIEGKALYAGLGNLSARDLLYAGKGRAMAYEQGAAPEVIAAIVDRQTAGAYITGTDFWTTMSAAERARWVLDTDSWMRVLTPIVAIIRLD